MTTSSNKSKPKNKIIYGQMKVLKCKNCGAPINPELTKCEYCDASYVIKEEVRTVPPNFNKAVRNVKDGIMTLNEARQMLGLESIRDDVRAFHKEMKYIREAPNICGVYDTDGNSIKTVII